MYPRGVHLEQLEDCLTQNKRVEEAWANRALGHRSQGFLLLSYKFRPSN